MNRKRLTVLIATENALLGDCLQHVFRHETLIRPPVRIAGSTDLLRAVEEVSPDVVLFDMDGLGALPEEILIQLKNGSSTTRTLVLAPRADEHAIARALRCGASGVLGRGEGIANLLPALTTVASGQAWARRQAIARALEGVPRETAAHRQALTPREREILAMLGDGYRNKELAVLLKIKEQTVKIHLHSLFKKLHVRSRVEAALKSIELFDAPQDPSETHRARRRSG